jgi:rhodanese-related sulfurtransferase
MPSHTLLRRSPVRLDAEQARLLLAAGAALLDVRRNDDSSEALDGGMRIPPDELPNRIDTLPRNAPVVLACT